MFFEGIYFNDGISISLNQTDKKFNETDLFPAVREGNIQRIKEFIKNKGDINALDTCKRNALQATLQRGKWNVQSCVILIQNGINIENKDDEGVTAIATLVYFYKFGTSDKFNNDRLELFRYMVEVGADLNVFKKLLGNTSIRKKIRSHPELEEIVQEVNAKKANHIFSVLKGDFQISKLVCQMLDPYAFYNRPQKLLKGQNS